MNIIEAYRHLEKGYRIKRAIWDDWFSLYTESETNAELENMLYCQETRQFMLISLEDVLAEDWETEKKKALFALFRE